MKAIFAMGLTAALLTQCGFYVREPSDRNKDSEKEQQRLAEEEFKERQNCDYGVKTGCVTGQLVISKVFLDNDEFFDANTLVRSAVGQLSLADTSGEKLVAGKDFEASLLQPLSNENFADGFSVYLRGDEARAPIPVTAKGGFKIDYLDSGVYDIRIQRKFDVKVADKRLATPSEQPVTTEPQVKKEPKADRILCLVIYSDVKAVEISKGAKQFVGVDRYKAELLDRACSDAAARPTLSL